MLKQYFARPSGIGTGLNIYMFHPVRIIHGLRMLVTQPRFFMARARNMLYQAMHPGRPWLTQQANEYLISYLKSDMTGFEWGSGRSTAWLSRRCSRLVSVEDNRDWYDSVGKNLVARNVDYRYIPATDSCDKYAGVIDEFPDKHFDFIIVDGSCRDLCMVRALPKVKRGGIVVVDNIEQGYDTSVFVSLEKIPTNNGVWRTDIFLNA